MYWGRLTAIDDAPNAGTPSTNVRIPQWYQDGRAFIASSILTKGVIVRGIFDVEFDPLTFAFRSVEPITFPHLVMGFDYEGSTGEFLVAYSEGPGLSAVARAQRSDSLLQIVDVIADSPWAPLGARGTGTGTDAVIYGRSPTTSVQGFYRVIWSPSPADSLVLAVDLVGSDGAGFDVDGSQLVFGMTTGSFAAARTSVLLFKLDTGDSPRVLADLKGSFLAASLHPSGNCVAVCRRIFGDPSAESGDRISIVNLSDGSVEPVDVKTRPCTFAVADFVSWNGAGNAFAFSAGGYTAEGAEYPRQLWVRSNVTCP